MSSNETLEDEILVLDDTDEGTNSDALPLINIQKKESQKREAYLEERRKFEILKYAVVDTDQISFQNENLNNLSNDENLLEHYYYEKLPTKRSKNNISGMTIETNVKVLPNTDFEFAANNLSGNLYSSDIRTKRIIHNTIDAANNFTFDSEKGNDIIKYNSGLTDTVNLIKSGEIAGIDTTNEVGIIRTDKYGNKLSPKDAFRELSYVFHGQKPSKAKYYKRIKKRFKSNMQQNKRTVDTRAFMNVLNKYST